MQWQLALVRRLLDKGARLFAVRRSQPGGFTAGEEAPVMFFIHCAHRISGHGAVPAGKLPFQRLHSGSRRPHFLPIWQQSYRKTGAGAKSW